MTLMSRAALLVALAATVAQGQSPRPVLSAEEVTSIRSVVGGIAQWYPDGSRLLIGGALGGSDLWSIPAAGGFPQSLSARLGETAFLQSNQVKFSPDGQWIAYLAQGQNATELFVRSVANGRATQVTRLGARINSYAWAPDSRRLALAGDKYGSFDIWVASLEGAITRLTSDTRYEVFPAWTPDGRSVVYVRLDERWLDHDVLELPAAGGGTPRLIVSDTDFFDYQAGGTFGYPLVSPDGSQLLFRSHRSGWVNYWSVPMRGGTPRRLAAEAANQSGARFAPDGKSVLYLSLFNGMQDLRVVPSAGGTPQVIAKPAEMGLVNNAEWSPNGLEISYTLETPVDPADLFVVARTGGTPRQLTRSAGPAHIANALIRPKKVTYKTKDGFTIPAYLYEPVLAAGAKAPGILYIHGGPTAQFSDTYQAEVQYLAMRGYAVLLPNIRGSSGYGKAFEDANNACWGRCDLVDVTAGTDFLRTLSYVDGERMGITGTSYGGCMSLAAAAFAPGVFQAAVAVSGYGDWFHMIQEQEMRHLKLVEYEFGPLPQADAVYRASSPIFNIRDIQTPIMLLHGTGIPLPRSEASRIFAERLEMAYKPFVYKTYPNENYYVRRRENLITMYGDIASYFDQHLKHGRTAAAPAGSP
ncbi:MAG: S9 family peptidase [Gemmatimonadetes bacterium]|nr:S9 family peptidase [Gemmatimonadota bacterium]